MGLAAQNRSGVLRQNPNDFYLYIIKFKDKDSDEIEAFYIVPGSELVNDQCFGIQVENYALTPISQRSLRRYSQVLSTAASESVVPFQSVPETQ
jgi:hypothetical protein